MKTIELQGAALDWAVAKCEGLDVRLLNGGTEMVLRDGDWWYPSESWAQGGPIIAREWISTTNSDDEWLAEIATDCADGYLSATGPTPLIAAMRCYVASKLGDEVEIPAELMEAA